MASKCAFLFPGNHHQLSVLLTFLSHPTDPMWWFCVSPLPTPIPSTMSRPCGTQKSSISAPELLSFWWAASWTCAMLTWKLLTGPGDLWLGRGTGAQGEGRDMGAGHHCGFLLNPEGDPLTLMSLVTLGTNSHQNQQQTCSLAHSLAHTLTRSCTHSHTCSLAHSRTRSLTHSHSLTHLLTRSLTLAHSRTHSLAHSLTLTLAHSRTCSLTHLLAHSLTHSHARSLTHSLAHSLAHSRTCSLTHSSFHVVAHPCGNSLVLYSMRKDRQTEDGCENI